MKIKGTILGRLIYIVGLIIFAVMLCVVYPIGWFIVGERAECVHELGAKIAMETSNFA